MSSTRWARPPRVALVTSSYNYIADGVALTLNRLVGYLEARGVDVLVFAPVAAAPAFPHVGRIAPVPSIALPLRAEYRLAMGLPGEARRRLEAFDPDLIHIAVPDWLGHQALALGRAWGLPVVASYHTRYETYLKDYGLEFARGFLLARLRAFYAACDEVYAPSDSMIASLTADGFAPNLHLWRRGVDTARFDPARRDEAWRSGLGVGEGEVVVAFIGRLVREKRLDTVAQVLERLRAAGVPHRALIVGEGPDRAMLERAAPEAIFTGFLGGEDLARAYASSDIFLFPSDTESFGNVTLEAMASGLPAVCVDATGSRSLVVEGSTGYLAPPGDAEACFRFLATLARDPALRSRMGAAARARSLEFSWEESMAGLLRRYEALTAGREQAAA